MLVMKTHKQVSVSEECRHCGNRATHAVPTKGTLGPLRFCDECYVDWLLQVARYHIVSSLAENKKEGRISGEYSKQLTAWFLRTRAYIAETLGL
jgi:hypothetical protein